MRSFLSALSVWVMCVFVALAAAGPLLPDSSDETDERELEDERDLESFNEVDDDDASLSSWDMSAANQVQGPLAGADVTLLHPGFAWIAKRPPAPAHC